MHPNYSLASPDLACQPTGQRVVSALRSITASISLYSQLRQLSASQSDIGDNIFQTLKAVENKLSYALEVNYLDEEVAKHITKELEEVRKNIKHISGKREASNLLEKISEAARSLQDVYNPPPMTRTEREPRASNGHMDLLPDHILSYVAQVPDSRSPPRMPYDGYSSFKNHHVLDRDY